MTGVVELLVAVLGLGVAGLDPAGALIAAAALAAGARERSVLAYGLVVLVGTALLGTSLSLGIGTELTRVDWLALLPAEPILAGIELGLGVLLLAWGAVRFLRRPVSAPKPQRVRAGTAGLVRTGALFALSAALDPTFLATTVLAGRSGSPVLVVVLQLMWALVSQAPLVFILVAVARGNHESAVRRFTGWWDRIKPIMGRIGTFVLLAAGVALVLDAGWWFATGRFLIPQP